MRRWQHECGMRETATDHAEDSRPDRDGEQQPRQQRNWFAPHHHV
eukprot:SAG11_NODE_35115_length_268_cov_0.810651_1_plen_44_part_01